MSFTFQWRLAELLFIRVHLYDSSWGTLKSLLINIRAGEHMNLQAFR